MSDTSIRDIQTAKIGKFPDDISWEQVCTKMQVCYSCYYYSLLTDFSFGFHAGTTP